MWRELEKTSGCSSGLTLPPSVPVCSQLELVEGHLVENLAGVLFLPGLKFELEMEVCPMPLFLDPSLASNTLCMLHGVGCSIQIADLLIKCLDQCEAAARHVRSRLLLLLLTAGWWCFCMCCVHKHACVLFACACMCVL